MTAFMALTCKVAQRWLISLVEFAINLILFKKQFFHHHKKKKKIEEITLVRQDEVCDVNSQTFVDVVGCSGERLFTLFSLS